MYLTITMKQIPQRLPVEKFQFGAAKIFRNAVRGDFYFSGAIFH